MTTYHMIIPCKALHWIWPNAWSVPPNDWSHLKMIILDNWIKIWYIFILIWPQAWSDPPYAWSHLKIINCDNLIKIQYFFLFWSDPRLDLTPHMPDLISKWSIGIIGLKFSIFSFWCVLRLDLTPQLPVLISKLLIMEEQLFGLPIHWSGGEPSTA